jgi:hypothetical protein
MTISIKVPITAAQVAQIHAAALEQIDQEPIMWFVPVHPAIAADPAFAFLFGDTDAAAFDYRPFSGCVGRASRTRPLT